MKRNVDKAARIAEFKAILALADRQRKPKDGVKVVPAQEVTE